MNVPAKKSFQLAKFIQNIGGANITLGDRHLKIINDALNDINLQGESYPADLASLQGK
jgi:hypothetical protein